MVFKTKRFKTNKISFTKETVKVPLRIANIGRIFNVDLVDFLFILNIFCQQ